MPGHATAPAVHDVDELEVAEPYVDARHFFGFTLYSSLRGLSGIDVPGDEAEAAVFVAGVMPSDHEHRPVVTQ